MNQEVVISGAWTGFEQRVNDWAKGTHLHLTARRAMGMVLCSSDVSTDLGNLLIWLKSAVESGSEKNVAASFESALFPPLKPGDKPTLIHGKAAEREEKVLEQLPSISATPRSMVSGSKARA